MTNCHMTWSSVTEQEQTAQLGVKLVNYVYIKAS